MQISGITLRGILLSTASSIIVSLNFQTGTYTELRTTYSPISSLPGWSFSNSTGGYSLDGTQSFAANTPRITSAGLLVEASATNLCTYSQAPGNWAGYDGWTLTTNTADPAGGTNGFTLSAGAGAGQANAYLISQPTTWAGGVPYTGSIWARTTSGTAKFSLDISDNFGNDNYSSDFTATTTWQRFTFTYTPGAGGGDFEICGASDNSAATIQFAFPQVELGSVATSYIPTPSNAAVTRAADVVSQSYSGSAAAATVTTAGLGAMTYPYIGVTNQVHSSSNVYNNTYWSVLGTAAFATSTIPAPDGSLTARQATFGPNNGTLNWTNSFGEVSSVSVPAVGTNITLSCWVRSVSGTANFALALGGSTNDYSGPTFTANTTWTRYSCTFPMWSGTDTTVGFQIFAAAPQGLNTTGTETGTPVILFWGPQMEFGVSSVNGYVPTVTNPVTMYSLGAMTLGAPTTNLLPYSTTLTTGWSNLPNGASVLSSIAAPDNSITAYNISAGTTNGLVQWQGTAATTAGSTSYTVSCFLKYGSIRYVQIGMAAASDGFSGTFDLVSGILGIAGTIGAGTVSNQTITPMGNGWYRVSVTGTLSSTNANFRFCFANSANPGWGPSYIGLTTDYVTAWGPQVETGTVATGYVPTTTTSATGPTPPWTNSNIQSVSIS